MTQRKPVSNVNNAWYDSEPVSSNNMTTEQNFNVAAQNGIINNQFGSGILPNNLIQNILWDSALTTGILDGTNITSQNQPSDTNLGNQLQITLSGSMAAGEKTVKVAIIGLDLNENLQYDTFIFETNESQYTQKHYTYILLLLFNDFVGNPDQSFNLGGRIVISEAAPFTVSRDPIMTAQDVQPNLFFRDFFITGTQTLNTLLATALPLYNINSLNIQTGVLENQIIAAGDVTTQIGEKFLATTNNIQKITLLLSVQNSAPGQANNLMWSGDLIISVYALQSVVDCITDIIPDLPIEFSPYNIPLAQLSFSYSDFQDIGITLDGVPQPIDFVFSNTPLASGSIITPNNFYLVSVKRAGAANTCDILIASGANISSNSRVTTFSGSANAWVDLPEFDLWYRVYTDAVQVSDGQAYESGQGLIIPKTAINTTTNTPQDYSLNGITFSGTSNAIYTAILSSTIQNSGVQQDQRTGNPIYSLQQYIPNVEMLNVIDLGNLEATSEPLKLGTVSDLNIKSINSAPILASFHSWTFVGNTILIKLIDDITDPRYDLNVLALASYLTTGAFVNAQMIPDVRALGTNPNLVYRIASATLCSMIYGDVDGNGIIDTADVTLANQLVGANLNASPPLNSQITTDGYTTTVVNGYVALTQPFINVASGIQWQVVNPSNNVVVASGIDGILEVNPNNGALASFESPSTLFNTITNIGDFDLVILNNANQQNNGSFQILSVDAFSNNILDISKLLITPNSIEQIMRADILGTFDITSEDGYLIENWINKVPPFPSTSLPTSKIGTQFSVLKITIDPFTWLDPDDMPPTLYNRTDDYSATAPNRATALHTTQDIFKNDGYMQNYNYLSQPLPFNIVPQFSWEPYLVVCNGIGRFVPTVFTSETGLLVPSCQINGIACSSYQEAPVFDPGRIDAFFPNNIIIGAGGDLVNPDGSNYKVDFEVGTVVLEIPDGFYTETTINVFQCFVADIGTGYTQYGYPAMRFSDCSTVPVSALINNQVQFSVSLQSFSPNLDGYTNSGLFGVVVDGKMGVFLDYKTAQLTLNFTNLYQDSVLRTLNTKVQIQVFLKKGGFNNQPLFVNSDKVANLLNINNAFSGAGIDGGLNASIEAYSPSDPNNWAGSPPITIAQALDRLAQLINNDNLGKP
jgi:hypothetical protein